MNTDAIMTPEECQIWRIAYASAFALGGYHPTIDAAQSARQTADRAVLGLRIVRIDRPAAGIEVAAIRNEMQSERKGTK